MFRTKQSRDNELQALQDDVELLTKIYGMESRIGIQVLVDRILEFEFAGTLV